LRNFRKLEIWGDGISLAKKIYEIARKLPDYERFGLSSQMMRAATSIPANLAEGASRKSEADFGRFIEIALGSAFELETLMTIAKEVGHFGPGEAHELLKEIEVLEKKANSLLSKLRNNREK